MRAVTKACCDCKKTLPLSFFPLYHWGKGRYYRRSYCRPCFNARDVGYRREKWTREKAANSEWYRNWKKYQAVRMQRLRARRRSSGQCVCGKQLSAGKRTCQNCLGAKRLRGKRENLKAKLAAFAAYGGRCSCPCGCQAVAHEILTIDHIGGWRKFHTIKKNGIALYRWLRRNGFPKGFRVLCMNCNFALGHYGYCPHELSSTSISQTQPADAEKTVPLVN